MGFLEQFNPGSGFRRYFKVRQAVSREDLETVFRVRHEVYCVELEFEATRPDGMESDAYDAHSLHCLLTTSGDDPRPVGCNRLVLADPDEPDRPLPFEHTCEHTLDRSIIDPTKLSRRHIAEFSRLAVRASYRRRRSDTKKSELSISDEDFGDRKQPRFPYVPVGLYMSAIYLAQRNDIEWLFVLTEPRLAAHFARLGVTIKQIGEPVEHRGKRMPSVMHVPTLVKELRWLLRQIFTVCKEDIDAEHARRSS